ncbi:MAG TPA: hypothetical protein VJW20_08450 [Candidatus Angelobacter sp.]|nr:hypothetical protein [Candidatus Angelobacter sp.]
MGTTVAFYQNGYGDRFIDSSLFNDEVAAFLRAEEQILNTLAPSMLGLVEVGCMHGRYLQWAIENRKRYFGVDVIHRYIQNGRRTIARRCLPVADYQFLLGGVEQLSTVVKDPHVHANPRQYLMLFPFNSFGNMDYPEEVIKSLKSVNLQFVISSYQTTEYATSARAEYYALCGYEDLRIIRDNHKVGVTSSEGLRSYAFNPTYLMRRFRESKIPVVLVPFVDIGMACISAGLAELLTEYEAVPTLYRRPSGTPETSAAFVGKTTHSSNGLAAVDARKEQEMVVARCT